MSDPARKRAIPAVEKILQALAGSCLPRPALTAVVRMELQALRESGEEPPTFEETVRRVARAAGAFHASRIQPVINATGVLIHTNLGRVPLGQGVASELNRVATSYTNLEFDLSRGERGERAKYLEHNLALLCGAEAATVVNNCAAALVLVLRHFTAGRRKEVILSRGELVEIGGGFRIPEIMATSGAKLREVGTTNRTTLDDFRRAIGPKTAMILKVHRSNFSMDGFVASPDSQALAELAHEHGLPFVHDLGSGAVCATEALAPVNHEPTPAETLRQGVDLVCCSGDKLFGGPQAGIVAGRADHVRALKKNPFFRALRCDRLVLTALQATVDEHLRATTDGGRTPAAVPVLQMLAAPEASLRARAANIAARLTTMGLPLAAAAGTSEAKPGGGTMPDSAMPSATVEVKPAKMSLKEFARRLRTGTPPVVGYVARDALRLDLRTVFAEQDEELLACLARAALPDLQKP